ncbi:hypothetical protein FOZ63_014478, partial [Perkinsus olseni]
DLLTLKDGNATSLVGANDYIYSIIQLLQQQQQEQQQQQQQQQEEEEEEHSSPTTTRHIEEAREVCRYLLPPSMVYDTLPSSSSDAVGSAVHAVIRVYTDSEEYRDRQEEDDNLILIFNKVMGIPVAERLLLPVNDEGDDANNYDVMLIDSVISMLRKLPDLPSSTTQASSSSLTNMGAQQQEEGDDDTPTAAGRVG